MNAIVFIPLTQGKVAILDFEDFEKVRDVKWCAQRMNERFYGLGWALGRPILLHRFILDEPDSDIDHEDGDGLNCVRSNMRICSRQKNTWAFQHHRPGKTSQFYGVSWKTSHNKWCAQIRRNRRVVFLGLFHTELEAALAYDAAALARDPEFHNLNFPK